MARPFSPLTAERGGVAIPLSVPLSELLQARAARVRDHGPRGAEPRLEGDLCLVDAPERLQGEAIGVERRLQGRDHFERVLKRLQRLGCAIEGDERLSDAGLGQRSGSCGGQRGSGTEARERLLHVALIHVDVSETVVSGSALGELSCGGEEPLGTLLDLSHLDPCDAEAEVPDRIVRIEGQGVGVGQRCLVGEVVRLIEEREAAVGRSARRPRLDLGHVLADGLFDQGPQRALILRPHRIDRTRLTATRGQEEGQAGKALSCCGDHCFALS